MYPSSSSSSRRVPFQESANSAQKRSRSALTTRLMDADEDDDDGQVHSPPNKKQLTISASSALDSFAITSVADARHDILQTEVDTLQAELEHAYTLRDLDQRKHQKEVARLEKKLEFAVEEAKEAQQMMEEVRQESDMYAKQQQDARKRSQKELRKAQKELSDARLSIAQYEAKEEEARMIPSSSTSSYETNASLRERLQAQRTENEQLKDLVAQLKQDQKQTKEDMEAANKEALKPVEPTISEASPTIMRELNKVRIELSESERKNRQYKKAAEATASLRKQLIQQEEKTKSHKRKATLLENELKSRTRETERLAVKLEAWKKFGVMIQKKLQPFAKDIDTGGDMPPEEHKIDQLWRKTAGVVDELEREKLQLKKVISEKEHQAQDLQHKVNEMERSQTSIDKMRQEYDQKVASHEQQVKILQNQERVRTREIESLREIVDTFDKLPLGVPPGTGTPNKPTKERTARSLQVELDSAKQEIQVLKDGQTKMKQDLNKALETKAELQKTHNTVLEKFGKLKDALYAERSKAESAEQRACRAEELAGKGSFNPNTTRVLHLSHNPLTEALKQEVAVLKRQIQVLKQKPFASSENKGDTTTSTATVTAVGNDVDPNKLHQRLKESFKEQIGRFREGVYLITGLKIDMIPDERPKFKVRSVFAEQEQDHLLFQWPTGKNVSSLDLLGTELAQTLTTTPSYEYVKRFHSIPAFVASVQLHLFEKQTIM
mmetsp:Transcript_1539/g.3104  ORF Transcript_1539/g.3104 Transcript_1539/m.3104 type:complete len:723 (+) Transcript_1539:97-2265(+)